MGREDCELISVRTRGAGHIKHDRPCEDYGQVKEAEDCKIFAVADGHGDSNCPRSAFGSETACRIALEELESFCTAIAQNEWEDRILQQGDDQEKMIRQLIASIVVKWSQVVNADFEGKPLTQEERAECTRYLEAYDKGEKLEHIYGTTLICGLLTDRYLLLLQQGDGKCVVFGQDGRSSEPIPWDAACFENVTTSMCDADAAQRMRYCVIDLEKKPVAACFAASDGVDDSFATDELLQAYYSGLIQEACRSSVPEMAAALEEALPKLSQERSQDDITVCGFMDREACLPLQERLMAQSKLSILRGRLQSVEDRLKSINGMGRMDQLRKGHEENELRLAAADQNVETAKAKLEAYENALEPLQEQEKKTPGLLDMIRKLCGHFVEEQQDDILNEKKVRLQEKISQAEKELEQVRAETDRVEQEYQTLLQRTETLEQEKKELQEKMDELQKV